MSVTIEHTVWCDGCSEWVTYGGSKSSKKAALREVRKDGWTRRKIGDRVLDLCPSCASKDLPSDDAPLRVTCIALE